MKSAWFVLRAEGHRLLRSRASWLVLVTLFLVSALRVFAAYVGATAARAERLAGGGGEVDASSSGDAWAPFVEGWRAGLVLAAILLLCHAARGLAGDREAGLLRLATTRGASRTSLVLGRAALAPVLVLAFTAVTGLGAYLAARWFFAFGPLVEDGYEILSAEELAGELRHAVLAVLPALLALYTFGLFVSSLARSATQAVAWSLTSFLVFDLFKEALGPARHWCFAAFSPSFVDGSAMAEMAGMARGFSDAGFPAALLRLNLWLPWPWAVALVALACLVLSRRTL